jgi:hypothetical protein
MKAVILVKADTGKVFSACQEIKKIDGVDIVNVVTGPYDLIAYVNYNTISPRELIESISNTEGVTSTETCISID